MFPSKSFKYHNHKVVVDGKTFDSKLESERYRYLVSLQVKGLIRNLRTQVTYQLTPTYRKVVSRKVAVCGKNKGKEVVREKTLELPSTYTADFVYDIIYESPTMGECIRTIVEDTKGVSTETFRLKKKMMLYINGIVVNVIKRATAPIPDEIEITVNN